MPAIPKIPIVKVVTDSSFDPLAIDCPSTDNITTARFALVGEAPTQVEVREGTPFVGPAGSQLNRIMAACNIPRYQLYLTNACKAMLPNNNTNKLWTEKGFRCAAWGELQRQLIDELSEFKGKVIILLGQTAINLLIDNVRFDKISKFRGSIYRAEEFPHLAEKLAGKLIAITYHPSFTLPFKSPVNFYTMIADINKFKRVDEDPEVLDQPVILRIKPNFHEVLEFFIRIKEYKLVAFDIEATPKYITCFSLAIEENGFIESMSIPLMDNKGNYWTIDQEVDIWTQLADLLGDKDLGIICQNGMFDLMFVLRTMNIISDNFYFDTMLAQHIVYTELPKGLDFLTSTYTYFPYYKDEGKQSHLAAIKDWPSYWEYNAKDSAYLFPIMHSLQKELADFEAEDAMEYSMNLHKPLMEMEFNGILTDQPGIAKYRAKLQRQITAMQHGLNKIAGQELNINSSKQMIAYFYGICMIKPYVNRKSGNATCDAVALSRIARKKVKGSIEAKMILTMREQFKLLSTYFNVNIDKDNKLRCSHSIPGTDTGRISTSRTFFGTGTNLQNQPYIYKKFLIAHIMSLLCEADLAKAEAHVVAYLTQDANMIAAFESGVDVHSFNASKIFDVSIEKVIEEAKHRKVDQRKTMRYMGKKVVHASNYHMGPQTFSDQLAKEGIFISTSKCKELLQRYSARFPGLSRWHESIKLEVQKSRVLYNLFGRPKRFLDIMNDNLYRSAYSYKPQSTVAELLNKGLIKMANDPRLGQAGYDIDLLATVHDSVLFQLNKKNISDLLNILLIIKDHMTHTFIYKGKSFTIGLDAKIGYQWAGKTAEISTFDQVSVDKALEAIGV